MDVVDKKWTGSSGRELAYPGLFSDEGDYRGCPKCYSKTLRRDWPPSCGFSSLSWGDDATHESHSTDRRVCLECEAEFDIEEHGESACVAWIPQFWKREEHLSRWEKLKDRDGRLFTSYADWFEDSSKTEFVGDGMVDLDDIYISPQELENWETRVNRYVVRLNVDEVDEFSVDLWRDGDKARPLFTNMALFPAELVICALKDRRKEGAKIAPLKARFHTASGPDTDTIEGVRKAFLQHMYI